MQFRPKLEPKAPEGKIRFLGKEHGQDFLIGDFDLPLTKQEMDQICHENRGVGIEIYVYNAVGNCIFSA